jgi:hypothetical protein
MNQLKGSGGNSVGEAPDGSDLLKSGKLVQRLANDRFMHRNSSKYIEAQPYAFTPPFGAERMSLRVDTLVPNPNPKPRSPIVDRYPAAVYNTFKSVSQVDYRGAGFLPTVHSPKHKQQKNSTERLSSPTFLKDSRLPPTTRRCCSPDKERENLFIKLRKRDGPPMWMPYT